MYKLRYKVLSITSVIHIVYIYIYIYNSGYFYHYYFSLLINHLYIIIPCSISLLTFVYVKMFYRCLNGFKKFINYFNIYIYIYIY